MEKRTQAQQKRIDEIVKECRERQANVAILNELRKIQLAEYKQSEKKHEKKIDDLEKGIEKKFSWRGRERKNRVEEKVSAMEMAKLEKLISLEYKNVDDNESERHPRPEDDAFGNHLIYKLLCERRDKSPHELKFKMTDKKHQKFVQINDSFMAAYKLAKTEAQEILKMLQKRKKSKPGNPLLKEIDDYFRIDINIKPVFFDWDKLYERRRDPKWQKENRELESKYNFYEALEWAFEKYEHFQIECDQFWSSYFEQDEDKDGEKDPNGNDGPLNWACEWIPHDSKYYWKHRFCYLMHTLGVHSELLTLEDILEIKRMDIELKINFGEMSLAAKGLALG